MNEVTGRMAEIQRVNARIEADKTRAFRDQCAIALIPGFYRNIPMKDTAVEQACECAFAVADLMVLERAKRDSK